MNLMRTVRLVLSFGVLLACFGTLVGCTTFDPGRYNDTREFLRDSAHNHLNAKEYDKALYLSLFLLDAEPGDQDAKEIRKTALLEAPHLWRLGARTAAGSNYAMRVANDDVGIAKRVILWPANVLFDIFDSLTAEVGVCFGAGVKAQVTEAVAVGAQASGGEFMVGFYRGDPSVSANVEEFLDILPIEIRSMVAWRSAMSRGYALNHAGTGLKRPGDWVFQRARDYWAVGVQANVGVVALNVKFHPLQFWDAVAGIFFFDPLQDNWGSTRIIRLNGAEKEAIKILARQVESR